MTMNKNKNKQNDFEQEVEKENIALDTEENCTAGHDENEANQVENTDIVAELTTMLAKAKEDNATLMSQLQQLQADFDNYRKRNAKLALESRQKGVFEAVESMLPAFDAVCMAQKQITDENVLKGLSMVDKALIDSLSKLDIKRIEAVGQPFDPHLHNAVLAEEVEGVEAGIVLEEYSAGYTTTDTVVRVATVKVSK